MNSLNERKIDHINIVAGAEAVDRRQSHFDRIRLTHRALPEIDRADVDPSVTFLGKKLSFPLLISSMTGGVGAELVKINRNLAAAAEAEGVALAVGSQRVFIS
ncbi:MAG: alpha-hydroxy-acid oxidizing protein, partial [Kiritimatiellales bacterium]|nr:alpha-hydroxy-acid oxidizing protein [Kiritimatiellales bacterium]